MPHEDRRERKRCSVHNDQETECKILVSPRKRAIKLNERTAYVLLLNKASQLIQWEWFTWEQMASGVVKNGKLCIKALLRVRKFVPAHMKKYVLPHFICYETVHWCRGQCLLI